MSNSQLQSPSNMVDIVVVGAGLSGLQAAQRIQSAGLSCTVIEATSRIGGKTLSVQSRAKGPGINDLGAAWINDTTQSEMYKLFKRFGLQGEYQRVTGKNLLQLSDGTAVTYPGDSPPMSEHEAEQFTKLMDRIRKDVDHLNMQIPAAKSNAKELDGMTFREYCTRVVEDVGGMLSDIIARALLGVEASEVSALYMIDYFKSGSGIDSLLSNKKDGAQYLRIRQGTQSFSGSLAAELKPDSILLSSPVTSIEQLSSGDCLVRCFPSTILRCRKVVVSVPTTVYSTIRFDPPLPDPKYFFSDRAIMGYYSKMIYVFDQPWWRDNDLSGEFTSYFGVGPISFSRDTSMEADGQWSISCFIVGEPGREWSKLSKTDRYDQAWKQFSSVFQYAVESIPHPVNVIEMEWTKEQYFWGGPCPVVPPGVMTCADLKTPFRNVHFVGTETSDVWKGYLEGAVRSGQRGAQEVVDALGGKLHGPKF